MRRLYMTHRKTIWHVVRPYMTHGVHTMRHVGRLSDTYIHYDTYIDCKTRIKTGRHLGRLYDT